MLIVPLTFAPPIFARVYKGLFTYYVSQNQGFLDPPLPPPSAMVSIWLTPPPPLVSFRQHLPDAPFVLLFFT